MKSPRWLTRSSSQRESKIIFLVVSWGIAVLRCLSFFLPGTQGEGAGVSVRRKQKRGPHLSVQPPHFQTFVLVIDYSAAGASALSSLGHWPSQAVLSLHAPSQAVLSLHASPSPAASHFSSHVHSLHSPPQEASVPQAQAASAFSACLALLPQEANETAKTAANTNANFFIFFAFLTSKTINCL